MVPASPTSIVLERLFNASSSALVSLDSERLKRVNVSWHSACMISALLLMLLEGGKLISALMFLLGCEVV